MATSKRPKESTGHRCAGFGCGNGRYKPGCEGKSFHRFPADDLRCSVWVRNARRLDLEGLSVEQLRTKGCRICCDHFEASQWTTSERKRLNWNAVPTLFKVPNPVSTLDNYRPNVIDKRTRNAAHDEPRRKRRKICNTRTGSPAYLREVSSHSWLPTLKLGHEEGKPCRLWKRKAKLQTTVTSLRNKKSIKTNGGCETARTELCLKKKRKRKLAKEVKSKTCNDKHIISEQEFIIKIERDDDYEESEANSYLASEMEAVSKKGFKIKPCSSPGDMFETNNISEDSHGHSSHPADAAKMVKLEPDSDSTEWPAVTGLLDTGAATETEVKTEPCSDIESEQPVLFETSNQPHTLADTNMVSLLYGTIVKSEISSDGKDDTKAATTVYACELCDKCFLSRHLLLKHREKTHAKNSNKFVACYVYKSF